MKFYRYEMVQYARKDIDGEYDDNPSSIPNPSLELRTFNLLKETPKGYWIGYSQFMPHNLRLDGKWVSKTSRRRYAYPTKAEALENFIKRTEKRIKILDYQILSCRLGLGLAQGLKNRENL